MTRAKLPSLLFFVAVTLLLYCSIIWTVFTASLTVQSQPTKIINGHWSSEVEAQLEKRAFFQKPMTQIWNALLYYGFASAQKDVVLGKEGWLFSREEFSYRQGYEANIVWHLEEIVAAKKTLAKDGVKLMIVPMPSKARVYAEYLNTQKLPHYRASVYSEFITFLRDQKMDHIDSNAALREHKHAKPLYLRTDTHWSPYGAEIVARAVAHAYQSRIHDSSERFGQAVQIEGDLQRLIDRGPLQSPKELVASVAPLADAVKKSDLFSTPTLPVALIGTSYSADTRWGFATFLQAYLGEEVWNLADPGQGPFVPMRQFLKEQRWRDHDTRIVIWEIPERYLPIDEKGS